MGAGASRGASFVDTKVIAPPLDADFFVQVQRLGNGGLTADERKLLGFVRREFGIGITPRLEEFFTQVETIDRFHTEFHMQRGRITQEYRRQLIVLRKLIPKIFRKAIGSSDCQWHGRIAASLRPRDTVISFNYDCLIDRALQQEGLRRWKPAESYGFPINEGLNLWDHAPVRGPSTVNPIRLLKPHGSLNWVIDSANESVRLTEPYLAETADSIVPPSWDKEEVTRWPWRDVWRGARSALASANVLLAIGYSVPVTDQFSQALIRADVRRLEALVLVNPDRSARARFRNLVSSALSPATTVLEFDSVRDLALRLGPSSAEVKQARDRRSQVSRRAFRIASEIDKQVGLAWSGGSFRRGTLSRLIFESLKDDDQPPGLTS